MQKCCETCKHAEKYGTELPCKSCEANEYWEPKEIDQNDRIAYALERIAQAMETIISGELYR